MFGVCESSWQQRHKQNQSLGILELWLARQKGKRKRAADKVKWWPLALLNPDWPRYILYINTTINSEAKHRREREWKLTAVGNHKKLETLCSSARNSHMMNKSKEGLAFPRNLLWMGFSKRAKFQHLNNMTANPASPCSCPRDQLVVGATYESLSHRQQHPPHHRFLH